MSGIGTRDPGPAAAPPLALVTGASSGIGRAVAVALAAAGWRLLLTGRDERRLAAAEEAARAAAGPGGGGRITTHACDLASDPEAERLAASVTEPLAALVHSAGVFSLGAVAEAPVDDLDWLYRVNLRAPYLLTRELLGQLRAARGAVVFINSGSGLSARARWGQYAMTKHALRALADSLRQEEPELRVSSVYPGRTASPMQARVHELEGSEYRPERFVQPEDVAAQVAALLALPPTAVVTDVSVRPR